jgi:hypothetical protein
MVAVMVVVLSALAMAACSAQAPAPAPEASGVRGHTKPSAPVDVRLDSRLLGGGLYEVTLTATPTRRVKGMELALDGRTAAVGPTDAGQARMLTARIGIGGGHGRDIAGSALVEVGQHRRRAAATTRLGAAATAAARPVTIVRLPDGTEAAEVRP